jgi:signal transduction histidine kinase
MSTAMGIRRRLPALLLLLGGGAVLAALPVLLRLGEPGKEVPWLLAMGVFLGLAAYTRRRLPDDPGAWWFAVAAGMAALVQAVDGAALYAAAEAVDPRRLALLMLAQQLAIVAAVAAIAHLLGLFPTGRVERRYEQVVLRSIWGALVLPPIVLLTRPNVLTPTYYDIPEVANPYAVGGLTVLGEAAGVATTVSQALFAAGAVLLMLRYRRAGQPVRRRIRWLLLPAVLAVFAVLADLLLGGPEVLLVVLWISTMLALPTAMAVALLRPDLLDVDRVLRKSIVYGFLWLLIVAAYVAAAAGLGVVAGQRFSVGAAIALTVAATLVFHPARQRLERLADRWVFGAHADPARVIARLGAALEETVGLESLLPRMADTLQEGLGLRWARVRLEPAPPIGDEEPVLTVPIVLGDERLGVVECGPRASGQRGVRGAGPLTEEDQAVVATLARQAALAVRNVRLTAELEASRARLVRAQDAERRRIERNIHDGVQQDLVALTGHAAHVRSQLQRDPAAGEQALVELQEGLRRVIGELRELAHGIHPSVLSDRGLLEAVEALASRSALPVSVRADTALRGVRFAEEVEGAGYFTVAEALANAGKHAQARQVEVSLARSNGSLRIAIHDDGAGFDATTTAGEGLVNLAERLAALGGRLDVVSEPGRGTTVTAHVAVGHA